MNEVEGAGGAGVGSGIAIAEVHGDGAVEGGRHLEKNIRSIEGALRAAMPGQFGFDTLVVGARFAGSVLAKRLANVLGQRVLVVDKRPHIGGNAQSAAAMPAGAVSSHSTG